jgi:Family of unknown function (DUF6599)
MVQEYNNGAGSRLSLEIFEMKSPAGAYGMWTFKKGPRGEAIGLGDEGQLDDYYLNFWKGHYLVTVTGLTPSETIRDDVVAVGRDVDSRIKESGDRPDLVGLISREGLVPSSIRYFQGYLGVYNSIPILARAAGEILEGVRADDASGRTIGIFRYPDKESALKKLAELEAGFSAERPAADSRISGPVMIAQDDKWGSCFAQLKEDVIVFLIGNIDLSEAKEGLDLVIRNIEQAQKETK